MIAVGVACAVLYLGGDRWWPSTLLLFGPRWLAGIPLLLLVPLALWLNRRLLLPLFLAGLLVFGPFMGLQVSLRKQDSVSERVLRVLTCNVHGQDFNRKALAALIQDTRADVVALQECPADLPLIVPPEWYVLNQRGLALLSRYPFKSSGRLETARVPFRWPGTSLLHGVIQTSAGDVTVCSVHLPTPRYGIQTVLDRRTVVNPARRNQILNETWHRAGTSRTVREFVDALPGPVILAGDFNMPVESTIYRAMWDGYINAFSRAGNGYGYSQRTRIKGVAIGVRIDHVLAGPGLVPQLCEIGPDIGSDHLPVIADLAVVGAGEHK